MSVGQMSLNDTIESAASASARHLSGVIREVQIGWIASHQRALNASMDIVISCVKPFIHTSEQTRDAPGFAR
jgi:hypothetical protein